MGDIAVIDVCSKCCICGGQAWGTSRLLMSALRVVSVVARLGGHHGFNVCSTSCICGGQAWGTSRFLMSALRLVSAVARLGGHHGS